MTDQWIKDRLFPGRRVTEADLFERDAENQQPTPDQMRQNMRSNLYDLLSVIPGPANAISAYEAGRSANDAYDAFSEGSYGRGAAHSGMTLANALGAVLGLPFGKTAGNIARESRGTLRSNPGIPETLPTHEAARAARAEQLGYSSTPFYRGEKTGQLPKEGGVEFYSRDKNYADGFAAGGGLPEAREFRLNLKNAYSDQAPMTASTYAKLVEAVHKQNPKFAAELAEQIAPGKGTDWLIGFGKARPDFIVAEGGMPALIRHSIEKNTQNSNAVFRDAGFNMIDSGRDVYALTGNGIRLADALFDKKKKNSRDLMAGVAGAVSLPAALTAAFTSRPDQTGF